MGNTTSQYPAKGQQTVRRPSPRKGEDRGKKSAGRGLFRRASFVGAGYSSMSEGKITFHSQIGQDRQVLEHFRWKRDGFFVELGASDGVKLSNTLTMERDFGWQGICIEPLFNEFMRLLGNRHCKCVYALVDEFSGQDKTLASIDGASMLSGIRSSLQPSVKAYAYGTHVLRTHTLTDVLQDANAPPLMDFLSLDTEGNEPGILRGLDFKRFNFRFICVEHNYREENRKEIRRILEGSGYRFHSENRFDDNYVLALAEMDDYINDLYQ